MRREYNQNCQTSDQDNARPHRSSPSLAVLDWRNTPSESPNLSPAQRRTRSKLPMSLIAQIQHALRYYNRNVCRPSTSARHGAHAPDDVNWRKGQIVSKLPHRCYEIESEDGSSRQVRFSNEPPIVPDQDDVGSTPRQRHSSKASRRNNNNRL